MYLLYFDCFSGISGDMILGALSDLGVDRAAFLREMAKLGLHGEFSITFEETEKRGIRANKAKVTLREHSEHSHSHEGEHHHGRNLDDINRLLNESDLSGNVKRMAKEIFLKVAAAEAKVHGKPLNEVHFHEVGAADSIADIVGAAVLLDMLRPDKIMCSPLSEGSGFVHCAHGQLPVPVPATAEICAAAGIPLKITEETGEMVTPTGAAVMAAMATSYGGMPPMSQMRVGYGAGERDFIRPNLLRVYYGEIREEAEDAWVIDANIDDMSGEGIGFAMTRLFAEGAKDVWFTPIHMKKNRPAVTLSVLCDAGDVNRMERLLFTETTTIGLRKYPVERTMLRREEKEVDTVYGTVRVKVSGLGEMKKVAPEYDDCKKIALAKGVPFREVYEAAVKNAR